MRAYNTGVVCLSLLMSDLFSVFRPVLFPPSANHHGFPLCSEHLGQWDVLFPHRADKQHQRGSHSYRHGEAHREHALMRRCIPGSHGSFIWLYKNTFGVWTSFSMSRAADHTWDHCTDQTGNVLYFTNLH